MATMNCESNIESIVRQGPHLGGSIYQNVMKQLTQGGGYILQYGEGGGGKITGIYSSTLMQIMRAHQQPFYQCSQRSLGGHDL